MYELYFLALPLTMRESQLLVSRWHMFPTYLSLISIQGEPYLVKSLPKFPIPLDLWLQLIEHVRSLVRTFGLSPNALSLVTSSSAELLIIKNGIPLNS